jgi:hypothetical protein
LPRFELVPAKAEIKRPIRNDGPFCFCITFFAPFCDLQIVVDEIPESLDNC